ATSPSFPYTPLFRSEVELALEATQVHLQQPIEYRLRGEVILTTPGRVIFNAEIERSLQEAASDDGQEIEYQFINRTLAKRETGDLISELVVRYGAAEISGVLDMVKALGFRYATKA